MKNIVASVLLLFMVFLVNAGDNDLKGPKYKNAKASEKYKGVTDVKIAVEAISIKGPARKNMKVNDTPLKTIELKDGKNTKGLKGPRYKNLKVGS